MAGQLTPIRCINVEIRILFPERFILVFLQIMKHGMIHHTVSVNDRIEIAEVAGRCRIQEDRSDRIDVLHGRMIQIILIIASLHDRIIDHGIRDVDPAHDIRVSALQGRPVRIEHHRFAAFFLFRAVLILLVLFLEHHAVPFLAGLIVLMILDQQRDEIACGKDHHAEEKQYGDIIQPFTNVFLFFHFKHLVTLIPQKKSLFHT